MSETQAFMCKGYFFQRMDQDSRTVQTRDAFLEALQDQLRDYIAILREFGLLEPNKPGEENLGMASSEPGLPGQSRLQLAEFSATRPRRSSAGRRSRMHRCCAASAARAGHSGQRRGDRLTSAQPTPRPQYGRRLAPSACCLRAYAPL
jgi:hypothetical protein